MRIQFIWPHRVEIKTEKVRERQGKRDQNRRKDTEPEQREIVGHGETDGDREGQSEWR